jgi:GNAT superfamily N-acetyltransferase
MQDDDGLYSHVLSSERRTLRSELEADILKFEAVRLHSGYWHQNAFLYPQEGDPVHFAERRIAAFWALRRELGITPCAEQEANDRKNFLQRAFYAATVDDRVVGGLWVPSVKRAADGRHASISLMVSPTYRGKGLGTALLAVFEQDAAAKYASVVCSWGEGFDPAEFFLKQGYAVASEVNGGRATKQLRASSHHVRVPEEEPQHC